MSMPEGKTAGDTALMLADRAEIVEVLLRHGANVHAKNKEGNTALIERINSNRDP